MRTTRMIQGGRALAAALAGAPVYIKGDDGEWCEAPAQHINLKLWRRAYDKNALMASDYSVRADDARKVL
jgi:hypothetical protein